LDSAETSSEAEPFNTTTTARAYKALVSAAWRLGELKPKKTYKSIGDGLTKFLNTAPYLNVQSARGVKVNKGKTAGSNLFLMWSTVRNRPRMAESFKKRLLNNFDVAHLADFVYALHYLKTYEGRETADDKIFRRARRIDEQPNRTLKAVKEGDADSILALRQKIVGMLNSATKKDLPDVDFGRVPLDPDSEKTRHFFVTLHALRALSILQQCDTEGRQYQPLDAEKLESIVASCRRFCIEQCFYSARKNRHELDCTSLTFALVIYVKHSTNCDNDLVRACLDAIAAEQNLDGSWPATHPIIRSGGKPWHITSHELALSLCWIYFEPQLPDTARSVLLRMLEKYFRNWVMKTHVKVRGEKGQEGKEFKGWFDDHTITRERTAGWVTAIVCDFLATYHHVLCDYVNRRVVESLGIETSASNFLIDEHAPAAGRAEKWGRTAEGATLWPDLPPLTWRTSKIDQQSLAGKIAFQWSDPMRTGRDEGIAYKFAEHLAQVVNEPTLVLPEKAPRLFLLPGPPGTRKTSFVRTIPGVAKWPFVTVPAATFFEDGFDHLLTRATHVFRNLGYLRNCVIFFDEFEEFFRERFGDVAKKSREVEILDEIRYRLVLQQEQLNLLCEGSAMGGDCDANREFHDRTVAAFITSSMLPHLQNLHDAGFCFVFVATNSEETIDRAIQRPGRFDFRINVPHPTVERLLFLLDEPTAGTFRKLKIPFAGDETGAQLAKRRAWKPYVRNMKALLRQQRWSRNIHDHLHVLANELVRIRGRRPRVNGSTFDVDGEEKKILDLVDAAFSNRLSQIRIPFRDFEAALEFLGTNPKKREGLKKLTKALDDQVDDLVPDPERTPSPRKARP
jgi:hypothetical protein